MKILDDDAALTGAIPNTICKGVGERSLFDKISPFVDAAEKWLFNYVVPEELLEQLPDLMIEARRVVAYRALRLAAPALDVTLHPNGLAVVSTDSLAPASAERSREFREMLDAMTIRYLDPLLYSLRQVEEWMVTTQAEGFWLMIPFSDCYTMISYLALTNDWASFYSAANRVIDLTWRLAEKVVSPQIMNEICRFPKYIEGTMKCRLQRLVCNFVAAEYNREGSGERYIPRIVETLKSVFPEWTETEQGALFSPPVFRNKKKSGGYFF